MKKCLVFITIFFCVLSFTAIAQKNANTVSLTGKLKNFSNQVDVEDLSDLQYLLPATTERMIIPDIAGYFTITFKIQAPNYFRLGRNILYLSPGDKMKVYIDKNNPAVATFDGKGSAANLYLRNTPFPKGGSFLEAGRKIQKTPKATVDTILQIAQNRQKELDQLKGVSPEFKRLEYARIKADVVNSLRAGITSYKPRMSKDSLSKYSEEYKEIAAPLIDEYTTNFLDPSLMKMVVYRDVADEVIKKPGAVTDIDKIKDWFSASDLITEMKKVSDKNALKDYRSKIAALKVPAYKNAAQKTLANLLKFGKGDVAKDFVAVDINGNRVKLSSLKGKVIYVDLWATWCGPCLAEMPHFETLKEKYKNNPDIALVSLSIDDGIDLWQRNVASRNAAGIQWLVNRNILSDYDIVSIPRSLLINKDFKVVDINAPVPSAKELPGILDNLLK